MKTDIKHKSQLVSALLLSTLALHPFSAPAAGPLTPSGAPAPTMKTLQEIEPRTLISSAPYTISAPGSYYLSNNLTVATGDAITIAASGVTLDLNGFTISSTDAGNTGDGVHINPGYRNVAILNGSVLGGVTDSGSGTFSGPGFGYGIYGTSAFNIRVSGVSVAGCLNGGIWLNYDSTSIVEDCSVNTVGSYGIYANQVDRCSADDCGLYAIFAKVVSDSSGRSPYDGYGVYATTTAINSSGSSSNGIGLVTGEANNCSGSSATYYGLQATTANNCYGSSASTNSTGLFASDANGCYGYGGFAGIYCVGTAHGCYGISYNGYGLYAYAANNCYGYSYIYANVGDIASYAGVFSTVANNCFGYSYNAYTGSYNNYGIQAGAANNCYGTGYYGDGVHVLPGTAENCYGYSTYSAGLLANTANNCYGYSSSATGIVADTANNCYGESLNYNGMGSTIANNCYGETDTGLHGVICVVANNCFGFWTSFSSSGGSAVFAGQTANNCYGSNLHPNGYGLVASVAIGCTGYDSSAGGTGISAYIANSCDGNSKSITYKYNMP